MNIPQQSLIKKFLKMESSNGIILMVVTILAMFLANSPLSSYYDLFIATLVHFRIGSLIIEKPLLLWSNFNYSSFLYSKNFHYCTCRSCMLHPHWSYIYKDIAHDGSIIDSSVTLIVNRRIVDCAEPSVVRSLNYYANEVSKYGLVFE